MRGSQDGGASGAGLLSHLSVRRNLRESPAKKGVTSRARQLARDMRRASRIKERGALRHRELLHQQLQTKELEEGVAGKDQYYSVGKKNNLRWKCQRRLMNKDAVFSVKPCASSTCKRTWLQTQRKNLEHQVQMQDTEMSSRNYDYKYSRSCQAILASEIQDREEVDQESLGEMRREKCHFEIH